MKKTVKLFLTLIITASVIAAVSCKKKTDDPVVVAVPNVVQKAQSDTNFSILVSAVVKTKLVDALSNTQNLTVFAPLNNAFRQLGFTSASIDALNDNTDAVKIAALKNILLYHVIGTKYLSTALPTAANTEVTTLATTKAYVSKNAGGVFANGVKVAIADINVSNGVIHAVDRVIVPAAGNLVATASADPRFSLLVAAITNCDSANIVVGALTGAGPLTVMAPIDQAFIDAGFLNAAAFSGANAATKTLVRKILLHHVIPARVYSGDLTDNQSAPTALGQNILITLTGGAKVKGAAAASPIANIVVTDVSATNGVVHAITKVLIPN
jgi:uncharacterized surface protein with fasciclin (FAS1) repeats